MDTMMTDETTLVTTTRAPSTGGAVRIRGLRPNDTRYLLAQCIIAGQSRGEACAVVSILPESPEIWHRAGVVVGRLLLSTPDHAAMAQEIVETLVRSGAVGVVIVRGYAEMGPEIEALAHRTATRLIYAD